MNISKILLITIFSIGFSALTNNVFAQTQTKVNDNIKTVKLRITGMTCGGCASNVHNTLTKQEGVIDNEVEYPGDIAMITYDSEKITEKTLIKKIKAIGFNAEEVIDQDEKQTK